MLCTEFEGLITGSNSSGQVFICDGVCKVFVDVIPVNAPQDWELGPKMRPGEYGVFLGNRWHASGHSQYAVATAKTEADACAAAAGLFRGAKDAAGKPAPQRPEWRTV